MLLKSLRKTSPFIEPEEKEIFLPCLQSKIKTSSENQILSLQQTQLVVKKNLKNLAWTSKRLFIVPLS